MIHRQYTNPQHHARGAIKYAYRSHNSTSWSLLEEYIMDNNHKHSRAFQGLADLPREFPFVYWYNRWILIHYKWSLVLSLYLDSPLWTIWFQGTPKKGWISSYSAVYWWGAVLVNLIGNHYSNQIKQANYTWATKVTLGLEWYVSVSLINSYNWRNENMNLEIEYFLFLCCESWQYTDGFLTKCSTNIHITYEKESESSKCMLNTWNFNDVWILAILESL